MIFLPIAIFGLAIFIGYLGYQHDNDLFKNFAGVLVVAALGTLVIVYFALSVA